MTDYDVQHEFGLRVRENRKKRGLTQEQLAEAIGKSVDTISNIERGVSSTRIKTAAELASVLAVRLDQLFVARPRQPDDLARHNAVARFDQVAEAADRTTLEVLVEVMEALAKLTARPRGRA